MSTSLLINYHAQYFGIYRLGYMIDRGLSWNVFTTAFDLKIIDFR